MKAALPVPPSSSDAISLPKISAPFRSYRNGSAPVADELRFISTVPGRDSVNP